MELLISKSISIPTRDNSLSDAVSIRLVSAVAWHRQRRSSPYSLRGIALHFSSKDSALENKQHQTPIRIDILYSKCSFVIFIWAYLCQKSSALRIGVGLRTRMTLCFGDASPLRELDKEIARVYIASLCLRLFHQRLLVIVICSFVSFWHFTMQNAWWSTTSLSLATVISWWLASFGVIVKKFCIDTAFSTKLWIKQFPWHFVARIDYYDLSAILFLIISVAVSALETSSLRHAIIVILKCRRCPCGMTKTRPPGTP